MRQQQGGTLLGFILGLIVGLAVALVVAVYVTKVPIPFMNKALSRNAEQDAAEVKKNKDWDPNAPLYGKTQPNPLHRPNPRMRHRPRQRQRSLGPVPALRIKKPMTPWATWPAPKPVPIPLCILSRPVHTAASPRRKPKKPSWPSKAWPLR